MKTFTLEIDCANAAFHDESEQDRWEPRPELARLLRRAAVQVEEGGDSARLLDINGNTVGQWRLVR